MCMFGKDCVLGKLTLWDNPYFSFETVSHLKKKKKEIIHNIENNNYYKIGRLKSTITAMRVAAPSAEPPAWCMH